MHTHTQAETKNHFAQVDEEDQSYDSDLLTSSNNLDNS